MTEGYCKNILVGALEAGGTKVNCVIGYGNSDIVARQTFPTTSPRETLARAADFFKRNIAVYGRLQALAIAQFGPIEINKTAKNYGKILATTKPGWSYIDVVGYFSAIFDCPIAFQSDVNGAAIGEYHFGAARGLDNFVYVTIGTGIGGGIFVNGRLLNDRAHPEIGHMLVPRDPARDFFSGCCQFHNDCLEGLAAGPAIKARWGQPPETLGADHPAWKLEASYLAILCVNLSCCHAPERIILGGGVMTQKQIFPLLRKQFLILMHGYMPALNRTTVKDYIVPTPLAGDGATKGALLLAQQALAASIKSLT